MARLSRLDDVVEGDVLTITALQWAENDHVGAFVGFVYLAVGNRPTMYAVVFGEEGGGEGEGGEEEGEGELHFFKERFVGMFGWKCEGVVILVKGRGFEGYLYL